MVCELFVLTTDINDIHALRLHVVYTYSIK